LKWIKINYVHRISLIPFSIFYTCGCEFIVTGICVPGKHYMADTSEKLANIMELVEKRKYFTINRGRQYGKTITLNLLKKQSLKEYTVIKTSFEGISDSIFETEVNFCQGLLYQCAKYFRYNGWVLII